MNRVVARNRHKEILRFIAVGCAAATTHFVTVFTLVEYWQITPSLSNISGWLVAFIVSFIGHFFITFKNHRNPPAKTIARFFALSLSGFLLNETAYLMLLQWTNIHYAVNLFIVLIGVAVFTYYLSRQWVFFRSSE
jgi:putative flippase GtrA